MTSKSPPPQVIFTNAEGLASNSEDAFLILHISRQEVDACNIGSALERLHILTDSVANVRRYREAMAFLVGGYDEDPRPLHEIPEVRAYFKRLTKDWPHWLWFLSRGNGGIALLMSLLCRVRSVRGPRGEFGTSFEDLDELGRVMCDLFDRGNALFDSYGITENEAAESADSAVRDIFK